MFCMGRERERARVRRGNNKSMDRRRITKYLCAMCELIERNKSKFNYLLVRFLLRLLRPLLCLHSTTNVLVNNTETEVINISKRKTWLKELQELALWNYVIKSDKNENFEKRKFALGFDVLHSSSNIFIISSDFDCVRAFFALCRRVLLAKCFSFNSHLFSKFMMEKNEKRKKKKTQDEQS